MTTLEIHNATNLKLLLQDDGDSSPQPTADAIAGMQTPTSYGTVTLDPHLENVSLDFQKASSIGSVILTGVSQAAPGRSLKAVSLLVDGKSAYRIGEGGDGAPQDYDGGQTHFFYDEGWKVKQLQRREKDYPSLVR